MQSPTGSDMDMYLLNVIEQDERVEWHGQPAKEVLSKHKKLFIIHLLLTILLAAVLAPILIVTIGMSLQPLVLVNPTGALMIMLVVIIIVFGVASPFMVFMIINGRKMNKIYGALYYATTKRLICRRTKYYSHASPFHEFAWILLQDVNKIIELPWGEDAKTYKQFVILSGELHVSTFRYGKSWIKGPQQGSLSIGPLKEWTEIYKILKRAVPDKFIS